MNFEHTSRVELFRNGDPEYAGMVEMFKDTLRREMEELVHIETGQVPVQEPATETRRRTRRKLPGWLVTTEDQRTTRTTIESESP
jgi:hypothetical protein